VSSSKSREKLTEGRRERFEDRLVRESISTKTMVAMDKNFLGWRGGEGEGGTMTMDEGVEFEVACLAGLRSRSS
jgi:hypothetical protein